MTYVLIEIQERNGKPFYIYKNTKTGGTHGTATNHGQIWTKP